MKKYYVYILIDRRRGIRYKGMTQDLNNRLKEHNKEKTKTTSISNDWEIEYFEEFEDSTSARKREKYFKSAAGRRWIKNNLGPIPA